MGKGFPRIAENEVEVEPESGQVLLTVQDGDGGEFSPLFTVFRWEMAPSLVPLGIK